MTTETRKVMDRDLSPAQIQKVRVVSGGAFYNTHVFIGGEEIPVRDLTFTVNNREFATLTITLVGREFEFDGEALVVAKPHYPKVDPETT